MEEFWLGKGGPRRLTEAVKLKLRRAGFRKAVRNRARVGSEGEGHEHRKPGHEQMGWGSQAVLMGLHSETGWWHAG